MKFIEGQYYKALSRLYEHKARIQRMSLRAYLLVKAKKVLDRVHLEPDYFDALSLKTCHEEKPEHERSLVLEKRPIEPEVKSLNVLREEDNFQRLTSHTRASLMLEKMIEVIDREVQVLSQGEVEESYNALTAVNGSYGATQLQLSMPERLTYLGTIKDYQ